MNKLAFLIIILAIIVVVIGAIIVFAIDKRTETVTTEIVTTPVPTPTVIAATTPIPSETSVDTVSVDTITLIDVTDGDGNGEATREFADGEFIHMVTATLPSPGEGGFYEGWLVKADDSELFSTGKLTKSGDKYALTYTDEVDQQDFPQVVITLEKTEDETPETHILEGTFAEQLLL